MKPNIKKIIQELESKYGKIVPCSMAGTWEKSLMEGWYKDELCFWFETTDHSSHLARIDVNTGEIIYHTKKGVIV